MPLKPYNASSPSEAFTITTTIAEFTSTVMTLVANGNPPYQKVEVFNLSSELMYFIFGPSNITTSQLTENNSYLLYPNTGKIFVVPTAYVQIVAVLGGSDNTIIGEMRLTTLDPNY